MAITSEQLQQMIEIAESTDTSLGEDLWLIAERIMLYRLTRAGEQKRVELASMVHLLRKIISETEGEASLPSELVQLDGYASNEFRERAESSLSSVFTTIIDIAENMNSDQLYLLISSSRKMELPEQSVIDVGPLEKAEEYLNENVFDENDGWGV